MADQDVDTIRGAYEAFDRGDVPAVIGILDAGVEWHEPGGGKSPSGTFNGPGAVASEVFEPIPATFDEYSAEPNEFSHEGDRVVVRGRFKGRNKSGAELDTGFEHVFEMSDGKVVRFENKLADAQAWAVAWGA
jgi:ketosteroid isomerase-like protein